MGHIIKMFLITVVVSLSIFSATSAQTCAGAGASCIDSTFNMLCTCPAGTSCAPGAGGSFFCQYSFCLPDTMFCDGNIGVCCSGKCEQLAGAAFKTCTAVTTTTTTVTTTTTTTPVTTTTSSNSNHNCNHHNHNHNSSTNKCLHNNCRNCLC